jgi:phosphoserine aminotransferase
VKHCTYCPEADADVCIRSHRTETGDNIHVYAHATCAEARGIPPLYTIITPPPRAGENA